jgi:hypothetical protein
MRRPGVARGPSRGVPWISASACRKALCALFRRRSRRMRFDEKPSPPPRELRTTDKHVDSEKTFFRARLECCVYRFFRSHIVTARELIQLWQTNTRVIGCQSSTPASSSRCSDGCRCRRRQRLRASRRFKAPPITDRPLAINSRFHPQESRT